ncbi:Eukaryotic translation initiation factor 2A [Dirofilaria immitis]
MYVLFIGAIIFMLQSMTDNMVSHENLNLMHDEEYRHFCRQSYFQRGDYYKIMRINKAARNEFVMIQVAKVNTDCNFQLIAVSNSNDEMTVRNIFPTDHLNQNIIILIACSKLLRQANYFRIWYHSGGILRKRPHDDSEGLKYVQIIPEPKCKFDKEKEMNRSVAFVHFTILRMRLPITNNTEQIWKNIGAAVDMQQPKFRSYESLSDYQKSIFVPDSFIGKHSSVIGTYNLPLLVIFTFIIYT